MEASELRLGNLVEYNSCNCVVSSIDSPKPMKDKRFSDKYIIELSIDGLIDVIVDEVNPIPLTEEWLINKTEFKSVRWGKAFRLSSLYNIELWKQEDGSFLPLIQGTNKQVGKPIKYIHEVQNYVHALTGEELTIKH